MCTRIAESLVELRKPFSQQPAQCLLLDAGWPMTPATLRRATHAAQNVLALAASLRGQARVPAFGAAVLNSSFHSLCKMEFLRGNFTSIAKALESVSQLSLTCERLSTEDYQDLLNFSVRSILDELSFKSAELSQGVQWHRTWPAQVHITLITSKNADAIYDMLVEMMRVQSSLKLKRIEVVEVKGGLAAGGSEDVETLGYVGKMVVEDDPFQLDCFFKRWLLESSTELEHVRLVLETMIFKCDLLECCLNPSQLPFGHRFSLPFDSPNLLTPSTHPKAAGHQSDTAVYKLEALHQAPVSGVCPANLLGLPQRLNATRAWSLSWQQQQSNTRDFLSLCRVLVQQEMGLMVRLRHSRLDSFFFVISDGVSLLLTGLAPWELCLPTQSPVLSLHELQDSLQSPDNGEERVSSAVAALPRVEEMTPDLYTAGLYLSLNNNLRQTMSGKSRAPRIRSKPHPRQRPPTQSHTPSSAKHPTLLSQGTQDRLRGEPLTQDLIPFDEGPKFTFT